jgi:hypothetical protein
MPAKATPALTPAAEHHQARAPTQAAAREQEDPCAKTACQAHHIRSGQLSNQTVPSPGGQVSGMAGHDRCCGWAEVGRVWHPLDLPEGYHTPARGQSRTTHAQVPSRAAPGLACGRAVPGRGDATRLPACKRHQWSRPGEEPGRENS